MPEWLHQSIGYVTPNDGHEGGDDAIRAARRLGLDNACQRRLAHHRQEREDQPADDGATDVG